MDIDWNLITRYLAGTCSDEERLQLEAWLAEAPEHEAILRGAEAVVPQAERMIASDRAAEMLASLRRDIAGLESSGARAPQLRVVRGNPRPVIMLPVAARRTRWMTAVKVAAAILLLVGGAGLWLTLQPGRAARGSPTSLAFRDIVTARGQRMTFRLSDGSAVVLAPGSRLRVPNGYGMGERAVLLLGQAAFTVRHDATRPFTVHTAHGIATDLGTRFVVSAYEGDSATVVAVAEGAVQLRGTGEREGRGASLTAGQVGAVGGSGAASARTEDVDRYFAWTEGRLVFRNVLLRDAAAGIARWYDVDVRLESEALALRRLNASSHDEPVGDVLQAIALSLGLKLEISATGRVFTLRAR